ncbi:hypothetical protein DRO33_03225 [Candidatus Bathyarchaeota archaeon]|nr:MAG: hypothetical protein DRO33_03225 [Candidatus Bathyarchaeota archaeon]
MELIDLASRGWALRYLREARAELNLAREKPALSLMFSLEAAKKAQACIYHCLGSAQALEMLVIDTLIERRAPSDNITRLLLAMEQLVQAVSETDDPLEAYRLASRAVRLASRVVQSVLGRGEGE